MTEHQDPFATEAPAAANSSIVADISREIVKAHAQYYGRGPTKARTVWKEDIVVVILEEIFTRAERTLVDAGHPDGIASEVFILAREAPEERGAIEPGGPA